MPNAQAWRGTQRNLVCVFGPMPPYLSVCCHVPATLSDYRGEKKNNVVGNLGIGGIRLWSATAAVAKGLDLTLGVILGYVAA